MEVYVLTKQIAVDYDVPGSEEMADAATVMDYAEYQQACVPHDIFSTLELAKSEAQRLYTSEMKDVTALIWTFKVVDKVPWWTADPPATGREDYFDERYHIHMSKVVTSTL